ncbi:MAG: hypothetical protein PHX61_14320, partial [Alphaproteobacteria bacterium]|nr:hypothetical protein [Alphaproteobacteria bacterium]
MALDTHSREGIFFAAAVFKPWVRQPVVEPVSLTLTGYLHVIFVSLFVLAVFWSFKAEKKRDQLFMAMSAKNDFESISNDEA